MKHNPQPGLSFSARLLVYFTMLAFWLACQTSASVKLPPLPFLSTATPTATLSPEPPTPTPSTPSATPSLTSFPSTPTATTIPPTSTPYPQVTVLAVGDVMMGRMVNKISLENNDFSWPFASLSEMLSSADLTVGNLESPLVPDCPVDGISMQLCGSTRAAQALSSAGFDIMGFANNHSHDYGLNGRVTTVDALNQVGLSTVYDGVPWLGQVNGVTIGIFAYDDVNRDLDLDRVRLEVASFAPQADILIGIIHWGYEYQDHPSTRQVELAHMLADSGMRVIIGGHPHWIQPVETYGNSTIFYSLGNFVFDQTWSEKTREGLMVRLTIVKTEAGTTVSSEMIPIHIEGYGEPQLTDGVPVPTFTP